MSARIEIEILFGSNREALSARYFGGIPDNGDSRWARYGLLSL